LRTPLSGVLRRRLGGDGGSTLIELGVAMLVLSVAVMGVIGSMGIGMQLSGHSRQRSSGSAVATERIERARNLSCTGLGEAVCFSHVAINDPAHPPSHTDNGSPDDNVTGVNCQPTTAPPCTYKVKDGTNEPLIVDTTNGGLKHLDDPITVGVTQFTVYQYVTWVDDPNIPSTPCPLPSTETYCDYKRVTVVVTWKNPVKSGLPHTVTQSTFVSNGTITLPGVTPTPPADGSSPTPTPSSSPGSTPTPTPTATPASCTGGATGPTGTVAALSGSGAQAGYTNSTSVSVQLTATGGSSGPITGWLSNTNGNFSQVTTLGPSGRSNVTWTIPPGDGTKTIYARFCDGAGNPSATYSATITLDATAPSPAPGNLRNATGSPARSGGNCTFTMNWNASTDANLVGYRIYKQVNGSAFNVLSTTSSLSYQDTDSRTEAYAYFVRAYDKAGNESGDSNVLSFQKNSC
jgi:hypothetical protein